MKAFFTILLLGCLSTGLAGGKTVPVIDNEPVGEVNRLWDLALLSRVPQAEWLDDAPGDGVRSLLLRSVDYQGKPTRVFAYYSDPDLLANRPHGKKKYPGVVLLHGGAGWAFRQWVEKWAAEGYAAIAIDLCGNGPEIRPLPDGGPNLGDDEAVFMQAENGDMKRSWTYPAVSSAILAHSLLLSMKQVDADKTCLTGISWGGYLTCIVAALDNRFKAAAPVYGCGYMDELKFFDYGMSKLSADGKARWMRDLDPSVYLPYVGIPMLMVNGNTDTAFDVPQYQKSCRLIPQHFREVCIRPGMRHGHYEGWEPAEIRCFFESAVGDGYPPIRITDVSLDDSLRVSFRTGIFPYSAEFYYTNDTLSDNAHRVWHTVGGTLNREKGTFTAPLPQEGFRFGFVTLKDVRLMSVSTEFISPE